MDRANSCNCRVGWRAGPGSPAGPNLSQQPILATLTHSTRAEWDGAWVCKMELVRRLTDPITPLFLSTYYASTYTAIIPLQYCCLQFGVSQYKKDTDKLEQIEWRSPGSSWLEILSLIIQLVQSGEQFPGWVFFCVCFWGFFPFVS